MNAESVIDAVQALPLVRRRTVADAMNSVRDVLAAMAFNPFVDLLAEMSEESPSGAMFPGERPSPNDGNEAAAVAFPEVVDVRVVPISESTGSRAPHYDVSDINTALMGLRSVVIEAFEPWPFGNELSVEDATMALVQSDKVIEFNEELQTATDTTMPPNAEDVSIPSRKTKAKRTGKAGKTGGPAGNQKSTVQQAVRLPRLPKPRPPLQPQPPSALDSLPKVTKTLKPFVVEKNLRSMPASGWAKQQPAKIPPTAAAARRAEPTRHGGKRPNERKVDSPANAVDGDSSAELGSVQGWGTRDEGNILKPTIRSTDSPSNRETTRVGFPPAAELSRRARRPPSANQDGPSSFWTRIRHREATIKPVIPVRFQRIGPTMWYPISPQLERPPQAHEQVEDVVPLLSRILKNSSEAELPAAERRSRAWSLLASI